MKRIFVPVILLAFGLGACQNPERKRREEIAGQMETVLKTYMLDKWYPQAMDTVDGGFLSTFTFDFKPTGPQDKMIVTQARHTWTNARASLRYPDVQYFKAGAKHGFEFLKNKMWDKKFGGFYQLVDKQGIPKGDSMKTAYGNAFGIYGLAAYYAASGDTAGLSMAKAAFMWLEKNSHDPIYKGYYQHLNRDGSPMKRTADVPSTSDRGYKDQNSSIHLLEAFTELYQVWPDDLVRQRLEEMLYLIRDTIVDEKGNLTLFLTPDWKPVSFRDSSEEVIMKHHHLNHASYGHDIETAYLLIEASHVLGIKNDTTTMRIAKKMDDGALRTGWDEKVGGFYDEGYYFKDKPGITIIKDTKNWWAQSEGLNSLLLMADLYPKDKMNYFQKFDTLWQYCDKYLVDYEHGDFYSGGTDKEPEVKSANKGHNWKAMYHQYRGLSNCIDRLKSDHPEEIH